MKNKMQESPSQKTRILLHLKAGYKLTPLEAIDRFDCLRLSGRILEIRKMGFNVQTDLITTSTKKVIAEYSLCKTYGQISMNL